MAFKAFGHKPCQEKDRLYKLGKFRCESWIIFFFIRGFAPRLMSQLGLQFTNLNPMHQDFA